MKGPHLRLQVIGIALALLAVGCTREPARVTGPVADGSARPAPLIVGTVPGEIVPGSYIVVFKPTVSNVSRECDDIAAQQGFTEKFRYQDALKGFAADLSQSAIDALRNGCRFCISSPEGA